MMPNCPPRRRTSTTTWTRCSVSSPYKIIQQRLHAKMARAQRMGVTMAIWVPYLPQRKAKDWTGREMMAAIEKAMKMYRFHGGGLK